jgi:hypothetical protein
MPIEEPESGPVRYAFGQTYPTIASFYSAIQDCIAKLPENIFTGQKQLQLIRADFPLNPISNKADALAAIDLIKAQGEGASGSPLYGPNPDDMSHYYLFGELYHEKTLVRTTPNHWEYSGEDLPFPASDDIYPMAPITASGYPQSAQFDCAFTAMLQQLQQAWVLGGQEGAVQLIAAQTAMGGLGQLAIALMTTPIEQTGQTYGPCFRYVPRN